MFSQLNQRIAEERIADLHRVAAARPVFSAQPARHRVYLRPVRRVAAAFARISSARA